MELPEYCKTILGWIEAVTAAVVQVGLPVYVSVIFLPFCCFCNKC